MKCDRCTSRPAVVFTFQGKKTIYRCRRHRGEVEPDKVVGWIRLGKVRREERA